MLLQYFAVNGVEIQMLPLPTREANKDFELVYEIARQLEDFGINRFTPPSPLFFCLLQIPAVREDASASLGSCLEAASIFSHCISRAAGCENLRSRTALSIEAGI